jgi:glycosyltransferase involved in cell wall biosynthesis
VKAVLSTSPAAAAAMIRREEQSPSVGIVIPAYNSARFLAATLDSIQAQTLRDWQCVIVDDGSTDRTGDVARRYAENDSRISCLRQDNSGPAAARNRGFKEIGAAVPYITFMDADDIWLPDHLQTLKAELEKDPQTIAVSVLAQLIDPLGNPLDVPALGTRRFGVKDRRITLLDSGEPSTFASLAWTNSIWPPGVMLARREAYESAGGFDGTLQPVEDWDMVVRLSRLGDIRLIDRVSVFYRRHDGNFSLSEKLLEATRSTQTKTFFSRENSEQQQQLLRVGWRAWQHFYIQDLLRSLVRCIRKCHFAHVMHLIARIFIAVWRWIRGYPTARGI